MNKHLLTGAVAGVVVVAVVAGAGLWASRSLAAPTSRYVTAATSTGDVDATYSATGTISRKNAATASFPVSGTVNSVKVAVGDTVTAGQTLATLDTTALQLAVLQAEATVAQATASLSSAQHPTSTSSSRGGSGSGITIDGKQLTAAVGQVNQAVAAESKACDAVIAAWGGTTSGTGSSPRSAPSATASASGAAVSAGEIQACASARAAVTAANAKLNAVVAAMTKTGSAKGSSGSSTTVNKAAVASAKAAVVKANQTLTTAQDDLTAATLTAPISGTVGLVGLAKGSNASSGSISIVGPGAATVSFELPLAQRQQVTIGQSVAVSPAGSTAALPGKITSIAALETSGTSGDSPTYTTTVTVTDSKNLLASGAKASVQINVAAVTGVLRVPASAVTPTGAGTATVLLVASSDANSATSTSVKTGVVGGGWVEITSGLSAGQLVVLADRTAAIPSNSSLSRRSSSTITSRSSTTGSGTSAGVSASSRPSAGK